ELIAVRVDQVLHQREDGHRTRASRIEREPGRDVFHRFEIDIADELTGADASEADVNHAGARLHHIGGDQVWTAGIGADARDENVGLAANRTEIARVSMAPRDRRV